MSQAINWLDQRWLTELSLIICFGWLCSYWIRDWRRGRRRD